MAEQDERSVNATDEATPAPVIGSLPGANAALPPPMSAVPPSAPIVSDRNSASTLDQMSGQAPAVVAPTKQPSLLQLMLRGALAGVGAGAGQRTVGQSVSAGVQAGFGIDEDVRNKQVQDKQLAQQQQESDDRHTLAQASLHTMNLNALQLERQIRNEDLDDAQARAKIGQARVDASLARGRGQVYGTDMDYQTAQQKALEIMKQNPKAMVTFDPTGVKVDENGKFEQTYTIHEVGTGASPVTQEEYDTVAKSNVGPDGKPISTLPSWFKVGSSVPDMALAKLQNDIKLSHDKALSEKLQENQIRQSTAETATAEANAAVAPQKAELGIQQEKAAIRASNASAALSGTEAALKSEQLKQLKDQDVNKTAMLDAIYNGTADMTKIASLKGDARQKLFNAVLTRHPDFDMQTYQIRLDANKGFTTGKQGDQVQSFNTAISHFGELDGAINNLRNRAVPMLNKPINWLKQNATGDSDVVTYLAAQEASRKEFETFLNNNHALTESDKKEGQKILNENMSPAQQQAAIKSFTALAMARLDALNERYRASTGKDYPALISPRNMPVLNNLGFGQQAAHYGSGGTMVVTGQPKTQPQSPPLQQGFVRIKASDGSVHDVPQQNLGAAKQKDPGLQVMQ